ncbi:MAG: hypothetical protein ACRER5_09075 [Pseudomonas sp.]
MGTSTAPSIWRSIRDRAASWLRPAAPEPSTPRNLQSVNHQVLCEQIGEEDAGLVLEAIATFAQRTGKGTRERPILKADNPEILAIASNLQVIRGVWQRPLAMPLDAEQWKAGAQAFDEAFPVKRNRAERRAGKGR